MIKRVILVLGALFLTINIAYADMKYTKITSTDDAIIDKSAPPEIIQGMMANSNKTETFYIKGNNVRVDNSRFKTSTITMCDQQQTIHLEHDIKKYVITPFKVSKPKRNNTIKDQIKSTVTDTKKEEMIGQYKTHKYSVDTTIPESISFSKDLKRKEEIWVADIKDQMPICNPNNKISANNKPKVKDQVKMPSGLIIKKVVTANNPFDEGKISSTVLIKDISTTPLPASLFEIPEGYTKLSP